MSSWGAGSVTSIAELDSIAINVKARKLLLKLMRENPRLEEIMRNSKNAVEALVGVKNWVLESLRSHPEALAYYESEHSSSDLVAALEWSDYAAIRILDYLEHAGLQIEDLNLRGELAVSDPIRLIWLAVNRGTGGAKPAFFEDMLELFRQFSGRDTRRLPDRSQIESWMERYPSGLDPRIVKLRQENRHRILGIIIDYIDRGEITDSRFGFEPGLSREEKFQRALEWWQDRDFHLRFAVRSPELLNEMLGRSLDPDTMRILQQAKAVGIPFFVNPYYLSLLHVRVPYFAIGADLAIRDYVLYSIELVDEFGHILAWEKEDLVEPDKPNAAGWLLPDGYNVHRRYPDVAILIPDSAGRACGGLCAACQRMHDFQRGRLNFDLERLRPAESWPKKLARLMEYFENDSQLRDILVTGGDALMSSDETLRGILDAIYDMARRKREANRTRPEGEKFAEIVRVRLGTRLPVYLPQRITPELAELLAAFREKAWEIGIRQFVIQTHFESPMEVTPESRAAVARLLGSGWTVTNQVVFTAAASRRGHTAKLRQVLEDVGVLPYYTFVVKGYMENHHSYAPIARIVQEAQEEKTLGDVPEVLQEGLRRLSIQGEAVVGEIDALRRATEAPFLATDRTVLNLPGVGKSLTFRVIGITRYGRRILEFDHDPTRAHSPIIDRMGKVLIIESKSVSEYLGQLDAMGEELDEYAGLYGYSLGETEPRMPLYQYPPYDFEVTEELTHLELP